jgi:hypothetical protein
MRTFVPSVRTIVLIVVLFASTTRAFSQSITTGNGKVEIGLGLGPMFFLGDLGGNKGIGRSTWLKDVSFPLTKLAKGIFLNVYPTEWLGFRLSLNQGKIDGYDSIVRDKGGMERYRKVRNLNFRSNLLEAYGAIEFYPTVFFEQYDGLQGKFRPYGVFGVGVFHFNPKGLYYDDVTHSSSWVPLRPLRLEGQGMAEYPNRKPYSLTQLEVPLGFGFKYYIKENMYVGLEVLHRQTFTDYMDDVSTSYIDSRLFANYLTPQQATMANQLYYRQGYVPYGSTSRQLLDNQRGDATQNDAYFTSILRFGWRLNENSRSLRQLRCPSFY